MEEIIKKILEIEQKASEITDGVKEQKLHFEDALKRAADERKEEYAARVEKRLNIVRSVEKEHLDKSVSDIHAQTERQLAHLDKIYREKKDQFVEEIVSFVLA